MATTKSTKVYSFLHNILNTQKSIIWCLLCSCVSIFSSTILKSTRKWNFCCLVRSNVFHVTDFVLSQWLTNASFLLRHFHVALNTEWDNLYMMLCVTSIRWIFPAHNQIIVRTATTNCQRSKATHQMNWIRRDLAKTSIDLEQTKISIYMRNHKTAFDSQLCYPWYCCISYTDMWKEITPNITMNSIYDSISNLLQI